MSGQILVAYASRDGSTAQIADAIAEVLREDGAAVNVLPVKGVTGLGRYDAVVLGSAVRAGRVLPEAVQFAERHQHALDRVPVAYFVGCDRMRENTPANRKATFDVMEALCRIKEPVSVGLFAGKRDLHNPHPVLRWLLARIGIIEGDWRDLAEIRAWAAEVAPTLGIRDTHPLHPESTATAS